MFGVAHFHTATVSGGVSYCQRFIAAIGVDKGVLHHASKLVDVAKVESDFIWAE